MGTIAPKELKTAILDGTLIPFVGAGVSRDVKDTKGQCVFPSWRQLLEFAADRLEQENKVADAAVVRGLVGLAKPNFLDAARCARDGLHALWYEVLKEHLDPRRKDIAQDSLELARAVWKLAKGLVVITTNYDNVLEWAQPEEVKSISINASAELSDLLKGKLRKRAIWHLHGHVSDLANLVLTPDGYEKLYPSGPQVSERHAAALQSLRHLLVARTFLFIGFSLEDERFLAEVSRVDEIFSGANGPHFVVAREADAGVLRQRLSQAKNVEVLPVPDFGRPLIELLESLAEGQAVVSRPEAAPRSASMAQPASASREGDQDVSLGSVREAYRTVYNHQRTLFDRLTELSDALASLGLQFERWDPTHYSRPPRSTSEFFRRPYWAWDFIPAYALSLSWETPAAQPLSLRVVVEVETDTSFSGSSVGKAEPTTSRLLPVNKAGSTLWIGMFRAEFSGASWDEAWREFSSIPEDKLFDGNEHLATIKGGVCKYRSIHVPLSTISKESHFEASAIATVRRWCESGHTS